MLQSTVGTTFWGIFMNIIKRRRVPRLVLAAVLASGGLLVAGWPGVANASVAGTMVSALSQPAVVQGQTNQAGGDLKLTVPNTFAPGDQLTIAVAPGPISAPLLPGNCQSAGQTIAYSAVPTVSAEAAPSGSVQPVVKASLASTSACAGSGAQDELVLDFTNSASGTPTDVQTLMVSGITYNVGGSVPVGPIAVTLSTGSLPATGDFGDSDATVSDVQFTANTPALGVVPGSAQAISPLQLTELHAGAVGTGNVCFQIVSPTSVTFAGNSSPTVQVTGGGSANSTATISDSGHILSFRVSTPSSSAGSYTVGGVALDTGNALGPVKIQAGQVPGSSLIPQSSPTSCGNQYGLEVATAVISQHTLAGPDRFQTAATIFQTGFACAANGTAADNGMVVLARGDEGGLGVDALAANFLAGHLGTGVLLTLPDQLPAATLSAIANTGVSKVYVVGGVDAVSAAVVNQLEATQATQCTSGGSATPLTNSAGAPQDITVVRIGGADRYQTAADIATMAGPSSVGTVNVSGSPSAAPLPTAIVATGLNFPDALSASPMAYRGTAGSNGNGLGFPILLTNPDQLPDSTAAALSTLGIKQVLIAGGDLAVSQAVESEIESAAGIPASSIIRFAGADRTQTAALIAAFETSTTAPEPELGPVGLFYNPFQVNLARGDEFPDALSGGPFAGHEPSLANPANRIATPILLTDNPISLGTYTTDYLEVAADTYGTDVLTVFGGVDAVNQTTIQSAINALTGS
jgi:putative cell wall-binding protein